MLSQGFNLDTQKDGKNLTPSAFTVTATYNFGAKSYNERHDIDLRHYFNTSPPTSDGVLELRKIRKALEKIASK